MLADPRSIDRTWSGHEARTWSGHEARTWSGHEARTWSGHEARTWSGHETRTWSGHDARTLSRSRCLAALVKSTVPRGSGFSQAGSCYLASPMAHYTPL